MNKTKILINEQTLNLNNHIIYFDELYHGTTVSKYEKIVQNGFDLNLSGEKSGHALSNGISLTESYEIAEEHAQWAAEKFNSQQYIIKINASDLKILSGVYFTMINNDYEKAHQLYNNGIIDGVELCDKKTGDGCEEYEIFVFNIKELNNLIN